MLSALVRWYSMRSRKKRAAIFRALLNPGPQESVLDLGGGDGSHIASILPGHPDVTVADISESALEIARTRHGFKTMTLAETGRLNCADRTYGIVYCSSVIEHATLEKSRLDQVVDADAFREMAWRRQKEFAEEIRRVGKRYFVQTPHRWFPIESHTWLPALIVAIPRAWQIRAIRGFNRFWPKKTQPDWNLLTVREMRLLFPDSEIVLERSFGLIKSIMAVKR